MSKLIGREAGPPGPKEKDRRRGELARVAWPHIAKLLSFSGLVALLFVRPHPPVQVVSDPARASETDLLETLRSGTAAAVPWSVLAGADIRTGERTELLDRLNGEVVRVAGFIVPLDDIATGVAEFLWSVGASRLPALGNHGVTMNPKGLGAVTFAWSVAGLMAWMYQGCRDSESV